ncbi:MAG: phosphoribosylglycinamide formyltransferase [Woeseiaceae bacterium]
MSAAVLISGGGTNLQAFIDTVGRGDLNLELRVVLSNRDGAGGLERAGKAGIPTETINHRDYPDRGAFDLALIDTLAPYNVDLVLLAGFMRILTPAFIDRFAGRIFNIHPSLLPQYPGLDTHRRALEAGEKWHGSTVHFATEQLDGGPRIMQGRVPVLADDSAESLAARVLQIEHRIYPLVLSLFIAGRLRYHDGHAFMDGKKLDEPLQLDTLDASITALGK